MAILCAEAAKEFVRYSDGAFQIIGPVMQNSDLFVIAHEPADTVAMVQNKHYQADLIRGRFGDDVRIVPLMVGAVPYALVRDDADAGIMDYTKAMLADSAGHLEKTDINGNYDSFVLVASKSFMKTPMYREFAEQFNRASRHLIEDSSALRKQVDAYAGIDIKEKGWAEWNIKIKEIPQP